MPRVLGFLALSFAAMLWGSSFIAGKIALQLFSFPVLVALRFLLSAAVLAAWFRHRNIPLKDAFSPRLLGLGFLTVTATFLLQFAGLSLTTAVNAAVVIGLEPMVVPLVGALFFKERFPLRMVILSAVSVAGVWLTIGTPTAQGWWGILLVFVSTIVVGFWIFLTKRLMATRSPATATGLVTWGGLASLIPVSLLLIPFTGPALTDGSGQVLAPILALVFLGIFCTLGASFLWNWGLSRVKGGSTGIFLALEPLVAVLLAIAVLHESPNWNLAAGTFLVLAAATTAVLLEKNQKAA